MTKPFFSHKPWSLFLWWKWQRRTNCSESVHCHTPGAFASLAALWVGAVAGTGKGAKRSSSYAGPSFSLRPSVISVTIPHSLRFSSLSSFLPLQLNPSASMSVSTWNRNLIFRNIFLGTFWAETGKNPKLHVLLYGLLCVSYWVSRDTQTHFR